MPDRLRIAARVTVELICCIILARIVLQLTATQESAPHETPVLRPDFYQDRYIFNRRHYMDEDYHDNRDYYDDRRTYGHRSVPPVQPVTENAKSPLARIHTICQALISIYIIFVQTYVAINVLVVIAKSVWANN